MEIYFHKFIQKSPIIFPKIVTKTVYIRKLFRFHMNPQKTFPLRITDSFCSVFIELWPQSKTIYSMPVRTLSGKVTNCRFITNPQNLHKCGRSIKMLLNDNSRGHRFEDSFNINILNWKVNRKINSIRTWSSRKAEFLSKIASSLQQIIYF